ncbi:MAG TPA: DUF2272 domain-containing protein [Candidatus Binatia bacterium]|nr:DUF2272 domain-containing protein [Candidatus Binatia bacterium]
MQRSPWLALYGAVVAALVGCAPRRDAHVPPFAAVPYEPFSRDAAVAIALREWRAFGAPIDDAPPDPDRQVPADAKPERAEGMWQRVGEYWWLGQDAGREDDAWTGKHDDEGRVFPAERDGDYAWSAAFISYVMRTAGAGDGFPYSPTHATYVNAARTWSPEWRVRAERPEVYPPRPGDLICLGREKSKGLRYDDLPVDFAGHCDLVVAAAPGTLTVVGGNVGDAVTAKHVPVTDDGTLATSDGHVVDERYPWFVVVRVVYDR